MSLIRVYFVDNETEIYFPEYISKKEIKEKYTPGKQLKILDSRYHRAYYNEYHARKIMVPISLQDTISDEKIMEKRIEVLETQINVLKKDINDLNEKIVLQKAWNENLEKIIAKNELEIKRIKRGKK